MKRRRGKGGFFCRLCASFDVIIEPQVGKNPKLHGALTFFVFLRFFFCISLDIGGESNHLFVSKKKDFLASDIFILL